MPLGPFKRLPDQDYLLRRLSYDPETGQLRWKPRPPEDFGGDLVVWNWWMKRFSGKVAGSTAAIGTKSVSIDSVLYYEHRIIWKMLNGEDPPGDIDHRDRNRSLNVPSQIRLATRQQNTWNKKVRADSRWGLKGVTYKKRKRRFEAGIMIDGKRKYLGMFLTAEEAHEAYCAAAKEAYGEFWSSGR